MLAGFLGAGKTTLLNHLLSAAGDARIGVVVNDFGAVGIDAMRLAGQAGGIVGLGNGCLCCEVGEDGVGALLGRLAARRDELDAIVIEASGIAEPGTLVQLVLDAVSTKPAQPNVRTARHLVFGGLVEIVDAAEFLDVRTRHRQLDRHVGLADLVVLNKIDRVDPGTLWQVRRLCREANRRAPIVPVSDGAVDPELLFDNEVVPGRQLMLGETVDEGADDHEQHLHAGYESVSFVCDEPLDASRLQGLLDGRPAGLYRIKGSVRFAAAPSRDRWDLHTVGRYVRFRRTRWDAGEPRRTTLVLIGTGLERDAVLRDLHGCVADGDSRTDPDALLPVLRFAER